MFVFMMNTNQMFLKTMQAHLITRSSGLHRAHLPNTRVFLIHQMISLEEYLYQKNISTPLTPTTVLVPNTTTTAI